MSIAEIHKLKFIQIFNIKQERNDTVAYVSRDIILILQFSADFNDSHFPLLKEEMF